MSALDAAPPFFRRRFGAKLRGLRERAGLTLDDAAPLLDKSRSALHRIEAGDTRVDVHLVRSMMDLYNAPDPSLLDEAREFSKRPWYRKHGLTNAWHIDVETEADQVCDVSVEVVPELLQTNRYASAVRLHRPPAVRDSEAAVLRIRQQRISAKERPLHLSSVINELALRRAVGSSAVMRSQLSHLVAVAAQPTVDLRVLPLTGASPASSLGSFALFTLPGCVEPCLLHVRHVAGSLYVDDQASILHAQQAFGEVRRKALSADDSVALIESLAQK